MGRSEAEMVRSLKAGAVCAALDCGLIPVKKCAFVSTLDWSTACGQGFLGLERANYV